MDHVHAFGMAPCLMSNQLDNGQRCGLGILYKVTALPEAFLLGEASDNC